MRPNEALDEAASMGGKVVPGDQQRAAHVPEKVFEILHDLRRLDRPGEEPEVEVPDGHREFAGPPSCSTNDGD